MSEVTVIVPTLNEEEGVGSVLDEIPSSFDVLVVDGGSTDETLDEVEDYDVSVVVERGGKADAVRKGLSVTEGEIVFLIDGDGTYPAERMNDMLEKLDDCEMVLGSRFSGGMEDGSMSRVNRYGNMFLTWLANVLYGTDVTDLCTGLRGFRRERLDGGLAADGFEIEAALHSKFSDIEEVSIEYRCRKGESKLRVWDGFKIAKRLILERFKK